MTQQETLTQEIENLESSQFERLCYILTDVMSGTQLIHKGTDSRGQPRRSTVDSYSVDGKIVGEYSVDQKYFCDLNKPTQDINHALAEHKQAEKIYLLASVRMKPSEGAAMASLCNTMQEKHSVEIYWYDAEELAKYILKEALPQTVVMGKLSEFLPSLSYIYLSSPNTATLPDLPPNYQTASAVVDEAYKLLIDKRILLLSGISGIGKSTLAVKLARILLDREQLDTAYFIDSAIQIRSYRDLFAANCELGGQKINLLGTLKTRHSLVILDDLRHDVNEILEQLQQSVGDFSYVIITSQLSSDYAKHVGIELQVPFLKDEELIKNLVNWGLPEDKCISQEQGHLIAQRVKGYPLVLNCIRTSLLYGNLDMDELESFLENIAEAEVEGEKKLMFRLLNGHLDAIAQGVLAIQWLESQYISEALLTKITSKSDVNSLRKRSLIHSAAGVIKIHDVIYQCMQELSIVDALERKYKRFRQRFYQFFKTEREIKSADYYKALHIHKEKIEEMALESQEPGEEWYFYVHSLSGDKATPLPSHMESQLSVWPDNISTQYAPLTILEYIEYKLRHMDYHDPARSEYIKSSIEMLRNSLPQAETLGNDIYRSVVHHIGKLLVAANDQDNAKRCFQHILESNPESHEARLQLARIYKRAKHPEQAIPEYCKLLDTYLNGSCISMSVVLASYEDISSIKAEKDVKNRYLLDQFLMLQKAVVSMAVESFDQPYKALANMIKYYTYDHPQKAIQLMRSVPIPSTNTIRQDSCFAVAQMYKEIGKAIMWAEDDEIPTNKQGYLSYFFEAEEFYSVLPPKMLKSEYNITQRAENLLLLGRLPDAENVLMSLDDEKCLNSAFWNYRMGQALTREDTESLRQAVGYFQCAIDLESAKDKNSKFLSAFWGGKAKALSLLGDPFAKDCFEQALLHCGKDREKFRQQLQREMEQYLHFQN